MDQPLKRRCLQPISVNVPQSGAEGPAKRRASASKDALAGDAAKAGAKPIRRTSGTTGRGSDSAVGSTTARPAFGRAGSSILFAGTSSIPPPSQGSRPMTRRMSVITSASQQQPAGAAATPVTAGSNLPLKPQPHPTATPAGRLTRSSAAQHATPAALTPEEPLRAISPMHVPASYAKRRLSAMRKPQEGMDKLQNEYEALQHKLALLRRDSLRGNGDHLPAPQPTPLGLPPSGRVTRAAASTPSAAPPAAPARRADGARATPAGGGAGAAEGGSSQATGGGALDAAGALQMIRFSERHGGDAGALCAAAVELFEEPEFLKLCEQGLSTKLQSTKEGATSQSRILELAGMVKLLRRCLREALAKASVAVDQGVRMEIEHGSAQPGGLGGGPAQRRLEADAALARKEAAQIEARYRAERAEWMAEVDMGKLEVSRLNRELEALEEQRARVREDAQRADKARIQLQAEMKELRKAADRQMREAQMSQGEVAKALREERAAFEKREALLQDEVRGLGEGLELSQCQVESLQHQLSALQAAQSSLQASLEGKQTAEATLSVQLAQAQSVAGELRSQLAAAQAEKSALQQELRSVRNQLTLLENEVRLKGTRLEAAEKSLEAERAHRAEEAECLEQQLQQAQAARGAAQSDALAAASDAEEARRQASEAAGGRAKAEAALQQLQQQHDALQADHATLKQQAEATAEAEATARATVEELQARVADAEAAVVASKAEAGAQASRLAHLEGEFTALQEMMGEGEERDMVGRLLSRISTLQCAAAASEATRRRLHNQMVELRGNIRVFCRVRPHPTSAVTCLQGGSALSLSVDGKEHAFSFDKVFGPQAGQAQIFDEVSELVQSALDGYHVCLFSYGQTGAGKTHTMQGTPTPDGAGVIPRSVELILGRVAELAAQEWEYTLEASFIEVYNNTLRDLLADGASRSSDAGRISDPNAIKHDPSGGHTAVAGASRVPVSGAAHAADLVRRAAEARACAETAMNSTSSRSHCVFMLYIGGVHAASNTRLTGCLCLVDLAGSERLDRSLAEGQAKKEACSINQSLSALGDVFSSLSSKAPHVPYRNSKLTYLLQPCLGGNGKTLMFVNINPEPASAGETLCSLKFAAKVNGCETAARGGAKRNVAAAAGGSGGGGGFRGGGTIVPLDASMMSGRPSLTGKRGAAGIGAPGPPAGSRPKRTRLG